jgi:hypothetical protein
MRKSYVIGLSLILVSLAAASAHAVVLLTENFDSMGPSGTAPPAGWTVGHLSTVYNRDPTNGNNTAIVPETLQVDDGTKTGDTNGVSYNYGTTGAGDRALGNIPRTPNGDHVIQLEYTNNTGYPLNSFTLSYWGEQWHRGESKAAAQPEKLRVYYSTTAVGNYVRLTAHDFIAPENNSILPQAAIDGNVKHTFVTGGFAPATAIAPGAKLFVRWYDYNDDATLDHGLAIDDVLLEGVPEPAALLLLAFGGLALLRRR